jgi:hypothetical protein
MQTYIRAFAHVLQAEGQDTQQLLHRVSDAPYCRQILKRFAQIVRAGELRNN